MEIQDIKGKDGMSSPMQHLLPPMESRGGEQGAGQVYLEQVWSELSFDIHI